MSQHKNSSWRPDISCALSMLEVSGDGYIRLSVANLQITPLIHLVSGLDESSPTSKSSAAMPTEIVGYTEWVSNTTPTVSIGWEWKVEVVNNHILLRRIDEPCSNIMLQDSNRVDIGQVKTITFLETLIDNLNWRAAVQSCIAIRYS